MKLEQYKIILISIGLIGVLLISSPIITKIRFFPQGEHFSELYLLGPEHMAERYPHNILPNQNYTVYLDVSNHVGSSEYYVVYIKLLNATDPLSDVTLVKASPSQSLYEIRCLITDGHTSESKLTFSISNMGFSNEQLTIGNLHINGKEISINKSAVWNSTTSEYHYILLFELFTLNIQTNTAEFNNRFVYLGLNCSSTP